MKFFRSPKVLKFAAVLALAGMLGSVLIASAFQNI